VVSMKPVVASCRPSGLAVVSRSELEAVLEPGNPNQVDSEQTHRMLCGLRMPTPLSAIVL